MAMVSGKQATEGVMQYVGGCNSYVYIDETPPQLRHSCLQSGITFLPIQYFTICNEEGAIDYPYYFCSCPNCRKLFLASQVM